ncbi:1-(5-phosphoribosyl)-5-[(5-phosphoribosylamino)methylideneamino]imidazole-4-carboxamide isomerase [Candidatus Cyanaurora vandensis]|uniref:1-(5-phosphoribosyl)-5-[(5- phosphoribosylamino)methylideneamino]imidazole-4- carboxamide isomerase n=1 Tax=Candidatus Cyanaurora vandensis TaxID=2714958 RepID=UPI00257F62AA|nr:1-(5-phosphoribosyl)-5-[(5-phosphoribosylamino)methylideneamino]imidazole-4-carboxamide isomerase [Candidatus Cyanaurora vandensis]
MEVIPAIDLLAGRCVRLVQGDYARLDVVGEDPLAMARHWVELGATRLHLVDLTGAREGTVVQYDLLQAIAQAVACPVQVGGGIRSLAQIAQLLEGGVERVVVGTLALREPDLVAQACERYPGQVWVALDCRDGKIATEAWLNQSTTDALTLAQALEDRGVGGFIYTDIALDGTLAGPNREALRRVSTGLNRPVIASGGIGTLADLLSLLALEPLGVTGAIVGQALYKGTVDLPEALRAVGNPRWQDVPTTDTRFC